MSVASKTRHERLGGPGWLEITGNQKRRLLWNGKRKECQFSSKDSKLLVILEKRKKEKNSGMHVLKPGRGRLIEDESKEAKTKGSERARAIEPTG